MVIYPVWLTKDGVDLDSTASTDLYDGQTPPLRVTGNGREMAVKLLLLAEGGVNPNSEVEHRYRWRATKLLLADDRVDNLLLSKGVD